MKGWVREPCLEEWWEGRPALRHRKAEGLCFVLQGRRHEAGLAAAAAMLTARGSSSCSFPSPDQLLSTPALRQGCHAPAAPQRRCYSSFSPHPGVVAETFVMLAAPINGRSVSLSRGDEASGVQCPVCGRFISGVNRKQNLERHMLTHSGQRPYRCPYCPHGSNRVDNLKLHIRRLHFDSAPPTSS
ncbi:hypothetical protein O3P69_017864 [Scylla paramamosain]|uniref:C2H2-type domain-containing protein n=1 Tax=Scylla paramamosain TaxID=85552 RepID=A0AAW0THD4_SCYPA